MPCTTPGCTGTIHARGRCARCYHAWRRAQPAGTLADPRRWTKDEDATLRRLRRAGRHTSLAIGRRMGRSIHAVGDRARILRLPPMRRGRKEL